MPATRILWGQIIIAFLIVLIAIWAATQWTAWRLGFQPQLGHPWFHLWPGMPVYFPPAFFWWWLVYDTDSIRSASRRQVLFAAGAVLIGTTACFVWYWVTIGRYIESTDDAYVGGEVTTLSSKVAGLIETVAIVDNQSVKAGDLLLKLDDRDYRAQLARTEANIAARRTALVNVDATRRMRVSMLDPRRSRKLAAVCPTARCRLRSSSAAQLRAGRAIAVCWAPVKGICRRRGWQPLP